MAPNPSLPSHLLTPNCLGIYLIDLPIDQPNIAPLYEQDESKESQEVIIQRRLMHQPYPPVEDESKESHEVIIQRRLMHQPYPPVRNDPKQMREYLFRQSDGQPLAEDEKDLDIKNKIATLVQQTVHDTERKIKSIQNLKNKHREQAPYKIGFILSMIKKARDVLNELFNVAVKHRDEWKALEQLKIFELIVHTNVDTTNLVRQLVEIHIQHLNTTNAGGDKKRVVLL